MTLERRRYLFRGRVQGVGFRYFVRDLARDAGLAGWVRNLSDGRTVEAVAEGTSEQLQRFAGEARQGPPGSYVSEWEEAPVLDDGPLAGFRVLR